MVKRRIIRNKKKARKTTKSDKLITTKDTKDTKRNDFDPTKPKSKLDLKGWYNRFKSKVMPGNVYLVNIELRNGMHDYFMITTSKEHFIYKGAAYIIDDESKYFCLGVNKFALDYHQDLSIPIKRKVPLSEIRKTISSIGSNEVETAINPSSLRNFIESNFIQKVMKGQELDDKLKQILLISAVSALASTVMVVLFIAKSGMLDSVPGLGG